MQPVRLLCCAALTACVVGVTAQTIQIGSQTGGGDPKVAANTLEITEPLDGDAVGDCIQFRIEHEDIEVLHAIDLTVVPVGAGDSKYIDGPDFPDGGAPGLWPPCVDFRVGGTFPDGDYVCTARIYHMITGVTVFTDVITIALDRTLPSISMTLTPNKSCYNANDTSVALDITVTDAHGLASWDLYGTGIPPASGGPETSPFTLHRTIDMSLLADGTYDIYFDAQDQAKTSPACGCDPNIATAHLEFTVDSTPPGIELVSPGDCLKGTVTVIWATVNSPPTTLLTVTRVYVDGALVSTQDPTDTDYELDTTALADGPHTLRIEVDDECGNTGSAEVPFSTDNTSPMIHVTDPAIVDPNVCQEVAGPTVHIAFDISEDSSWELKIDGSTVKSGLGTHGEYDWTPGDYNCHDFLILATDECGNQGSYAFILKIAEPGECEDVILPYLICGPDWPDPWDGAMRRVFRPEVLNIDDITIRDILECHNVPFDENLIVQAVCVTKTTPLYKCGAFVFGPGSGLNTNFDTGPVYANSSMIDDPIVLIAFGQLLGNRCLLFSPPLTTYTVCVVYVIYDPVSGRVGPPITKEMRWVVEDSSKEIIRCNIEYFSTIAAGRTQKPKIDAAVAAALNAALDIPDDYEALMAFETIIGLAAIDFRDFIGPMGDRDVRFVTGYLIDDDEEPIGCLLIEEAVSLLWHP
jgi:hypothetical protein